MDNIKKDLVQEETKLSFEERFKQTVEKIRPYVLKLWGAKKKLIGFNVIILVLALYYLIFIVSPFYKSSVTILPDYGTNQSMLGQLSGLASLAGVNVGEATPNQIYQELATCESVLSPVIYSKYKTERYKDSVNLIQYFKIEPEESFSPMLQKRKMFLSVYSNLSKGLISTDVDRVTEILIISVKMPEAQLSADVVNNIAKSLDNYVQTQMRTNASEQRKYIGKRMDEVKDSLTLAENTLKDFNEQNRIITQSPNLLLEQSRMQRSIDILNAAYLQLAQQYELAKIQEVKDTPILNIEEFAKNPIMKTGSRKALMLIIILFLSAVFSCGYFAYEDRIKKCISYTGFDINKVKFRKRKKRI